MIVGVTGHRSERLDSARQRAVASSGPLAASLLTVRLAAVLASLGRCGSQPPRLVSSLAEGTDRLVAEIALGLGYALDCPLPFAREEYERDFVTASSKAEFRALLARASTVGEPSGASTAPRADGYLRAGRAVLAASDVLLAVWDGEAARGVGGTGQIVAEALAQELPVVWVGLEAPHGVAWRRHAAQPWSPVEDAGAVGAQIAAAVESP